MSELLDWVEQSALENLKFRLQIRESLAKEAGNTLTLLLAGLGATMAYSIKGAEAGTSVAITLGSGTMALWLMATAATLIVKCIMTAPIWPPTNEPRNLYQKDFTLDALREVELANMQIRIDQTAERNQNIALWLDRVRLMTVASPLIFLAGVAVSTGLPALSVRVAAGG